MDIETIKLVVQVGQFVLTSAVGFYVYMVNKDRVTNERISKLEDGLDGRLDDHASRIARLEEAAKHAPTHADLAQIYNEMKSVRQSVDLLKGEFVATSKNIDLITQHLLK